MLTLFSSPLPRVRGSNALLFVGSALACLASSLSFWRSQAAFCHAMSNSWA